MLNFLGFGSAFNTDLGNTSAYIKSNTSLVLIDCGSTVFSKLHSLGLLDGVSDIYVIITHTHSDHIGSLSDLIFYSQYILNQRPTLFFPNKDLLNTILRCMGVKSEFYNIIDTGKALIENEDLKLEISFFASSHVDTIPSYGLLLKIEGRTIFYSGDSNEINGFILKSLEEGTIDYLYHDTSGIDYDGNPHLSLEKLESYIKPELRHKVYCMHVDSHFDREKAKSLGFNVVECIDRL
ncbi:MAG TPA: MBL fold metallo-hydrolase [Acetivibrio sp.]|nr:ribonuclease Z [Clostridium sp.]HOQ38323.1 MBL fold metallo-hydrolase [Acetivibrio sp.]HPT90324.1 MBL fold metallo-hydrolase [Acetivibrio sp.]HQA58146.1 MBL fold metallo-hydrolase [Acetivibrio sp.]